MSKINTSLENFPQIWKLNDKRLRNLFKKYQKLVHISKSIFERPEQRVVALRYFDIKEELDRRGNLRGDIS